VKNWPFFAASSTAPLPWIVTFVPAGMADLRVVVAVERRAEHDRGQPTARDSLVKVGPRGRGRGETAQHAARTIVNVRSGWGLDPGLFVGCAQKRWSGQ
jgi:hypothetical protein